jgi:hypothetical protein
MDRDGLTIVPEARPTGLYEQPQPGQGQPARAAVPPADTQPADTQPASAQPASADPRAGGRAASRGGRGGTFRALGSRPFRYYFIGQVASASGSFLQQTAIGWLVLELTKSPASLGLVLAVGGVPSLILGPWGGTDAALTDL